MRYAVAHELAVRNPADASAIVAALPALPAHKGHRAIPHGEVSEALATVRASTAGPAARLALEFAVLTASRLAEATGARWAEIDMDGKVWTIPADRMKAKRVHRVPLSDRAVEILTEARKLTGGAGLVFPSPRTGQVLAGRVLGDVLRRCGIPSTMHGFRASFSTWAAEAGVERGVREAALAHAVKGVEGAYQRSDLFDRRRAVMDRWSQYIGGSQR